MKNYKHGSILPLLVVGLLMAVIAADVRAETCDIVPVAVWSETPTLPPERESLDRLIDSDLATFCCFLDDTPTGKNPKTLPPHGGGPVTAWFVIDLGKVQRVDGIRFVAQKSWANCMAEKVSIFACEEPTGNKGKRCLKENHRLPPVNTFNVAHVSWEPVTTRYLGVQVLHSYDSKRNKRDWWRGAEVGQNRQAQLNKELQCQFGWLNGSWHSVIYRQPDFTGGPRYEVAGTGGTFTTQIAEVSCFRGRPEDLPLPNESHIAFPESRLKRDWMYQDCGVKNVSMVANSTSSLRKDPIGPDISTCFSSKSNSEFEQAMVERVLQELKQRQVDTTELCGQKEALSSVPGNDPRWKELYFAACQERRQQRLKTVRQWATQFVYVKHHVLGSWTHASATDNVSDEQFYERNPDFREGSQLCLATINEDGTVTNEVLIDKPEGLIRDPNLSFDAKTLVFSMRENFQTDDYHLYKMDLADKVVRQITFSPTIDGKTLPCSDTEPCFAPSGKIIFQSTRCVQLDVCWAHPTSNLYSCNADGQHVRRLGFDQVRTLTPQVLDDGRIIYTRWEYNDRNPFFQQSLFVMNENGTAQLGLYGNNSIYPSALFHTRGIPGSNKVISIVGGHHLLQKGKLAIIDPSKGSEGNRGIEYVGGASPDAAPGRRSSNIPNDIPRKGSWYLLYDFFGQVGPQWQYPYAFDEDHYLVAFNPEGYHYFKGPFSVPFGAYFMTAEGKRELLAFDWSNSCGQAIPVMPRQRPPVKPSHVDWSNPFGTFYVQDVYVGPGLEGVKRGTVKRLRVVALEYRAAGISRNWNRLYTGGSIVNTPVAVGNGSQDVKHVLGEVDVEQDGSVYFEVPARTAVYFQLLDEKGYCVQTMRSWTMVMPGERIGCVGCHENKSQSALMEKSIPSAMMRPAQKLQPSLGQPPHPLLAELEKEGSLKSVNHFMGVNRPRSLDRDAAVDGFSYSQMVQPILDKHCTVCHQGNTDDPDQVKRSPLCLTSEVVPAEQRSDRFTKGLKAFTRSYFGLTAKGKSGPLVNWVHPLSEPAILAPYAYGAARSKLMTYLEPSHHDVQLTDSEKRTVACWIDLAVPFCGSYPEANTWHIHAPNRETNTWNTPQNELYDYFQMKREKFSRQELSDIKKMESAK